MTPEALASIITALRADGTDTARVEAKRASGGLPANLGSTLSAFANTDGGSIILGLDEGSGFSTTGVQDAAVLQQGIANLGHAMVPPLHAISTQAMVFEGKPLVVAEIAPLDDALRPSRTGGGDAFVRVHDGDYRMSPQETQVFEHNRGQPRFDEEAVAGATRADLDDSLVASYIELRRRNPQMRRFRDAELLVRTAVLAPDGQTPTIAGLLSLGVYPQQFFPRLVIKASVAPAPSDPVGTRASNIQEITGAIPTMLDEAMAWMERNTKTRVVFGTDGNGRDVPEYPTVAIRELLSNALVHRDLAPYALNTAIDLRLFPDRLLLENPGGLWNMSRDALGLHKLSRSRNGQLITILQNVRTMRGVRVVEALAGGINNILDSLADAGMDQPLFINEVIRFKAIVSLGAPVRRSDADWLSQLPNAAQLTSEQRSVLLRMRRGEKWDVRSLSSALRSDAASARKLLSDLVERGLVQAVGNTRARTYGLAPNLDGRVGVDVSSPEPLKAGRMSPVDAAQIVRGLLSEDTPIRNGELAAELGWPASRVTNALDLLRMNGIAQRVGAGRSTAYILVTDTDRE